MNLACRSNVAKVITERPPCNSYHRSFHPVDLVLGGHGSVWRKLEDLRAGAGLDHQRVSITSKTIRNEAKVRAITPV